MTASTPTSYVFASCLRGLEDLVHTHPEEAGRFALELSAWLDSIQAEADEHDERIVDEP